MAHKVSVIIPNYNGKNLLAQNLPKVIKNCPDCEIIVVDDGSTDDSVALVRKKFKKVKVIANKKNLGFAKSVNIGTKASSADFILLLNTDVAPQANFLKFALEHFNNQNSGGSALFAVALADQSHEREQVVVRGRGGAKFTRGFLNHFALNSESGQTFWVSGGSGLFDKTKFLELDGFDPVFAPFYWEDIDLSYRARKQGYRCFFDSHAKVDHYHEEGAIKKTHSPSYIKTVAYKNQFLFVWKNISDYLMLTLHLLWLPYHFAKALISMDTAFFAGFFWALIHLLVLIFNYDLRSANYQLSDREVLAGFEKS